MGTSRNYQTQGIILKQTKLGEFDKIVTIYTPEFGKLRAVAKGACRPKSKLGGNVEPLTHSLMLLAKGRNLDIVTQSQTINGFLTLKSDLWRMACGLYVLELIDSFTVDGGENRPLFDLLLDTLHQLSQPDSNETALRYFELHLLHYLGYRPQLHRCVTCDSPLKPVVNFFSPSKGGLLCPHCHSEENRSYEQNETISAKSSFPLSVGALKVLRLWQRCDYATSRRVRVTPELSRELEQALCQYIRYIVQRELKSLTWLRELRRESASL
ncbi:MAG: DNA repair protein RecO [Dehalococcoidia bacterium]|nr:DNA repair protein RecO [Dehalococcoidia bacterium]